MKLKTSVEEQERKNTDLESRLTIMEQSSSVVNGQPQNGSQFEKAVVIPESVAVKLSGENGVVPEVVMVPANSKSSGEKEMDTFLDEAHKKSVGKEDAILRRRNLKKQSGYLLTKIKNLVLLLLKRY